MIQALGLALLLQAAPAPTVPAATPTPTPEPFSQAEVEYRVGVGDVLDVTVIGSAELSRTAPIQPTGGISLPLLGEVAVSGLTVPEVQRKVTTLLERDYLVDPQVEVKVREYQSQFVFVVGEVNRPGRVPLRGATRLLDVLLEAGGFNPRASGQVQITRPVEGNGEPQTIQIRLSGPNMTPQDQINLRLPMRNGDVVTATPMSYVTVQGEVARPGRYPIEGDLTVTAAVALAGGKSRFGSDKAEISRLDKGGMRRTIKVNLKDIHEGKEPDIPVQGNDTIVVSRRLF